MNYCGNQYHKKFLGGIMMARTTKKAAVETVAETAAPAAAEVLTYEEIVDKFKAKAPVDARVAAQVKLFGSVDGILYILIANGIAVVEPFDYRGADIEIDADADVFAGVIAGKKAIETAIANGDIKMQGNAGKAIILAKAVF